MSPIFKIRLVLVLAVALSSFQCQAGANSDRPSNTGANAVVPKFGYQIVNIWPHDSNAFTQGLILVDGKLLESTGQEGRSSLRSV